MRDIYLNIDPNADGTYQPDVAAGDLVIGDDLDTANQSINQLILANAGDWREFPIIGVGLEAWLKETGNIESLKSKIAEQMKLDGFTTIQVAGRTFDTITANGRY